MTTYNEYSKAKKAFFEKHGGLESIYASDLGKDSYHKVYTACDGKIWAEVTYPSYEDIKIRDGQGRILMFVTQFWSHDGLNDKYLEQY